MYKITLISSDDHDPVIYDPSDSTVCDYVVAPSVSLEIGEAGSAQFTLLPGHPLYDTLGPLKSFISIEDMDLPASKREIFYGRVITKSTPTITGMITYECEGALSFLLDSEVAPYKDSNGKTTTKKKTAKKFFEDCIASHNSEIGNDPRRSFTVGTVTGSHYNTEDDYSISSYTQTKSAIESNIINVYGGFLRVRKNTSSGGNNIADRIHYIDWIESYDNENNQEIKIGVNIIDQTNTRDGKDVYTVMRPIGKNGITLDEGTINVYSDSVIQQYGRIVKSVQFNNAATKSALSSKANSYKSDITKTLYTEATVNLVDLYYVDGTSPRIMIGDSFTNIQGISGTMIVTAMEIDLDNYVTSNATFKNKKSLFPPRMYDGSAHNKGNTLSRAHSNSSALSLKYIHELDDKVDISVKELNINVETLNTTVRGNWQEFVNFRISYASRNEEVDGVLSEYRTRIGEVEGKVQTLEGTAIIQDKEFIDTLSGVFDVITLKNGKKVVLLKDGADLSVNDDGIEQTVGKRLNEVAGAVNEFEGSALWTKRDNITGVCGEFTIEIDPVTGKKRLVIKSGGGMKIERNGVEYGLYDEGQLTGGLIVNKINGQNVVKIKGDKIIIGNVGEDPSTRDKTADQWFQDAINREGAFAQYLNVENLNAYLIEAVFVEGNETWFEAGNFNELNTEFLDVDVAVDAATVGADQINVYVSGHEDRLPLGIYNAEVDSNTNTLKIYKTDGSVINFNKASSSAPYGRAIDDYVLLTTGTITDGNQSSTFTLSYGTHRPPNSPHDLPIVTLKLGSRNIGRIEIPTTVPDVITANGSYTCPSTYAGYSKVIVNVPTVHTAPSGTEIGQYIVKETGNITADGKSSTFTLSYGTYRPPNSPNNLPIITLKLGSVNIGRIEIPTTVPNTITSNGTYTCPTTYAGYSKVVVNVTQSAPSGTAIEDTIVKKTGNITADGKSSTFTLSYGTYRPPNSPSNLPIITLKLGSNNIGRIEIPTTVPNVITANGTYTCPSTYAGYSKVIVNAPTYAEGQTAAGLTINASTHKISRALSSDTKSVTISASASSAYNASTHEYEITANAFAGSTTMAKDTTTSGILAYKSGWLDGQKEIRVGTAADDLWDGYEVVKSKTVTMTKAKDTKILYFRAVRKKFDTDDEWTTSGCGKRAYKLTIKTDVATSSSTGTISLSKATSGVSATEGLAYALGTSTTNLVPIFNGVISSKGYAGFKVTCGSATPKYYYFQVK